MKLLGGCEAGTHYYSGWRGPEIRQRWLEGFGIWRYLVWTRHCSACGHADHYSQ